LASGGDNMSVILWDLTDRNKPRQLDRTLQGHTYWVGEVAFSSDGATLASASDDSTVRLWGAALKVHIWSRHPTGRPAPDPFIPPLLHDRHLRRRPRWLPPRAPAFLLVSN